MANDAMAVGEDAAAGILKAVADGIRVFFYSVVMFFFIVILLLPPF